MRLLQALKEPAFLSAGILAAPAAFAASADSTGLGKWAEPSWSPILKMLLVLGVVIILIWVTLSLLKRSMGMGRSAVGGIQLLGGVSLGQRKSLQLVKLGSSIYMLGATDHHIGLIAEIKDPDEISRMLSSPQSLVPETFSSLFQKIAARKAAAPAKDGQNQSGSPGLSR